jgi:hypothetical protein
MPAWSSVAPLLALGVLWGTARGDHTIAPSPADLPRVTIYLPPAGRSAMYPSLVDLSGGEILCAFRMSTLDGGNPWTNLDDEIVCIKSFDGGKSWDPGTLVPVYRDDSMHEYINVAATPLLRDGRVLLTFYQVSAEHDEGDATTWHTRVLLTRSSDRGKTWSTPTQLDTPILSPASFGGIIRLQDGDLLISHYGCGRRDRPTVSPGLSAPGVMRSSDEGETWRDFAFVAYEPDLEQGKAVRGINETDITQLGDGRLLAMSRTYKGNFPLYRSVSSDNGYTWTFGPTKLHGLCPAVQWVDHGLAGGTTILAYHDRYLNHASRGGVYLAFSHDAGETWGYQTWIDGGAYPCLMPLGAGEVLLAYYYGGIQGVVFTVPFPTGIHARVSDHVVQLAWDRIKNDPCTYRVHRSEDDNVQPTEGVVIAEREAMHSCRDSRVEPGKTYRYVVTGWDGDRLVGQSWEIAVTVR